MDRSRNNENIAFQNLSRQTNRAIGKIVRIGLISVADSY